MHTNSLKNLGKAGQAVWLDFVSSQIIKDGTLKKMVKDYGLMGVTSNPSIFENAIAKTTNYDHAIKNLCEQGLKTKTAIYEALVVKDIQNALDVLRPVYDETAKKDGYVSLEVSPHLCHHADKTVEEGLRLWHMVNRPNLMIKVPGTNEGFLAIKKLIEEGINVNVTLLFSVKNYEKSAKAYIDGLNARINAGKSIDNIASVASFFISRIDSKIDELLIREENAQNMLGQVAIANAQQAFLVSKQIYESPLAKMLITQGGQKQRLLWASTGTKNKNYSDVLYVESLIGQNTVNTLPLDTINAFLHHGIVKQDSILHRLDKSKKILKSLGSYGVDFDNSCQELLEDGLNLFKNAYDRLLLAIEEKLKIYCQSVS